MDDQVWMALLTGGIGFLVATLGAVITGAVNARAKVDEGLRAERLKVYPQLWELTGTLSQWPRTPMTWVDVQELHTSLRAWYFSTGGLFLSDRARYLYGDVQELLDRLLVRRRDSTADVDEQDYEAMRLTCSWLRTFLAQDLETRRARSVWNAWQRRREFRRARSLNRRRLASAAI
jgi:hypothetical protein